MADRLHIFHVVREEEEFAKSNEAKHLDGTLLLGDEFRLQPFEPEIPGNFDQFFNQSSGDTSGAELGVDDHADATDVPSPPSELLVEGGDSHDLVGGGGQERKVSAVVNVFAPFFDHGELRDSVLDEHSFGVRGGQKEFMKRLLVRWLQWADLVTQAFFGGDIPGEVFE